MSDIQMTIAMKKRTKRFALRVITLVRALPKSDEGSVIGRQLLRSGTAVGANYRAVCRARSNKEFVSKVGVVVEEADESAFWMELVIEAELLAARRVNLLLAECNEILAMLAAAYNTAKRK
ncbi:MAG TPA: four helix bundle protein [Tepidisphaeraceae bacterium]|jgi:four helix bundle protein|nr:four helix bundle protein [Tepidisphaeraceae bacterium]